MWPGFLKIHRNILMHLYDDLRQVARHLNVDAVALVPGPNFARLFNKNFGSNERPLLVIIPVEGAPAAIVPNLELQSWALVEFEGEVFDWRDQDGYQGAFEALAQHMQIRSLAVEGQVMRVFVHHALHSAFPELTIVDGEKAISGIRRRKTPAELAALETAIATSEAALEEVVAGVKVGMTEAEIQNELLQALYRNGADALSFHPIVAAGSNAARPHASARDDYKIQAGDTLLIDFGARRAGFNADITRTYFVGHAPDEAAEAYETVLRANLKGQAATRPGVTAHTVDDVVTTVLEKSRFAEFILTKTGHGLGRATHEAPYIMRGNHEVLEPGMIFTIEPGLYKEGAFGIRIEQDILVTDSGCRSLTQSDIDLRIIG